MAPTRLPAKPRTADAFSPVVVPPPEAIGVELKPPAVAIPAPEDIGVTGRK